MDVARCNPCMTSDSEEDNVPLTTSAVDSAGWVEILSVVLSNWIISGQGRSCDSVG